MTRFCHYCHCHCYLTVAATPLSLIPHPLSPTTITISIAIATASATTTTTKKSIQLTEPVSALQKVITQHEPYELIMEDTNLGYTRSDKLVLIQIFQQGRTAEQKAATFAALAERLGAECGLPGHDLIISVARNEREDWSFGLGRQQFLQGDL